MSVIAPAVPSNPFLALRSFRREDAASFFGRDADLILVQSRLFSSRCTLLFAASGVGKSSFLDAKLAPAVESQWQVVTHRSWATDAPLPGLLASIAAAGAPAPAGERRGLLDHVGGLLAAPGRARGCLIVLDQFEEVFQHWRDSKALDEFAAEIARLVHAPGLDARVLISMREEFVGELSLFDNLIPDLFNNCYRLKNATRAEAEEIITRTALLRGVDCGDGIEPLLDDLVRSASRIAAARTSNPGGPLDESTRSRIPMPFLQIVCYRLWRQQMGGSGTGGRFLDQPPGPVRGELEAYCREKLEALTVPEQDLASAAFGFLMTRSGAKMAYPVDVLAQQARVDERPLLSVLQKLSEENVRILRAVPGHDAKPWFELYHDLYARFLSDWKRDRDAARELKENWKWRLVVVALLVVSAGIVAGLAIWRADAERDRLLADQAVEKNRDLASRLTVVSGLTPESREFTSRGIRYAAESFARMPTPSSRATLLKALQAPVVETDRAVLPHVELATVSPDGRFLAWVAPDGVMLKGLPGSTAIGFIDRMALVSAIAFSPDSATLAVAAWDGKIDVASTATAKVLTSIDVVKGGLISAIAYSPDGKSIAAAADTYDDSQHIVQVHSVSTGAPTATVQHKAAAAGIAFSPDGRYLLTGSDDATARVVDLTSGAQKAFPHRAKVIAVAFAPDSRTLATSSQDGVVQITEMPAGKPIPLTGKSSAAPAALAFSPKGRYLATGQVLWDLGSRTGQPLETSGSLNAIAFTPDDRIAIATSNEGAFVIATATRTALARLASEPSRIVGFGATGEWVAIKVADTATVYRIRPDGTSATPADADLAAQACALTTSADANDVKSFLGTEPALGCTRR